MQLNVENDIKVWLAVLEFTLLTKNPCRRVTRVKSHDLLKPVE